MKKMMLWVLAATLTICGTVSFASCSSNEDNATEQRNIFDIADKVWAYSQTHPDGFTLDIRTMTEPTEGIAVSYAATQNSHSRNQLYKVVSHALQHDGYVGGWLNSEDGLYYFDSTKLFPKDDLKSAIQFGKENGQNSVFILSTYTDIPLDGKVTEIIERGTLLVGTTGDYRPLSFCEPDGTYASRGDRHLGYSSRHTQVPVPATTPCDYVDHQPWGQAPGYGCLFSWQFFLLYS